MIYGQLKSCSSGLRVPIDPIFRGQFLLPSVPGIMAWEIVRKAKQNKNTHNRVYSIQHGHLAEMNGSAPVPPG